VSACGSKRRGTRAGVSASAIETDSATSYGLCGHPFLPAILLSIECAKNRMWLKAYLVRTLSGPRDVGIDLPRLQLLSNVSCTSGDRRLQ
jgi:hypothetical protein